MVPFLKRAHPKTHLELPFPPLRENLVYPDSAKGTRQCGQSKIEALQRRRNKAQRCQKGLASLPGYASAAPCAPGTAPCAPGFTVCGATHPPWSNAAKREPRLHGVLKTGNSRKNDSGATYCPSCPGAFSGRSSSCRPCRECRNAHRGLCPSSPFCRACRRRSLPRLRASSSSSSCAFR